MEKLRSEIKLCLVCMKEHEVQTVLVMDTEVFKDVEVSFQATYEYCSRADKYLETEEMIRSNSLAMKDAYRKEMGLLTSKEIITIRDKYKVSQKDFAEILGWGGATITRYENHQVQDRAHDDILRKIGTDPKWFLEMLQRAEGEISERAFSKYQKEARGVLGKSQNTYLMDSIQALYANFSDPLSTGGVELNLNKVVETFNYYALKTTSLHKVKLMKMLWYGDSLSYKRCGKAITGLVYRALRMGAVPVGYEQIMGLDGVEFECVYYEPDRESYRFSPIENFIVKELSGAELEILDVIIKEVGHLNSQEIISKMHREKGYERIEKYSVIPFSIAQNLSID